MTPDDSSSPVNSCIYGIWVFGFRFLVFGSQVVYIVISYKSYKLSSRHDFLVKIPIETL